MSCIYKYKNQVFESEAALDDFLLEKYEYESKFGDLVFSKGKPFLRTKDIIENNIQKEAAKMKSLMDEARRRASFHDGEEILEFRPPYIGVNRFLSGLMPNGKDLLMPEFRTEEYWSRRIESWTKPLESGEKLEDRFTDDEIDLFFNADSSKTYSSKDEEFKDKIKNLRLLNEDEAKQLKNLVSKKWEFQAAAGTAIHYIMQKYFSKNGDKLWGDMPRNEILEEINKSIDADLSEQLGSSKYNELKNQIISSEIINQAITYADTLKSKLRSIHGNDCEFYPELSISHKLNKLKPDAPDTLFGIIDLLVVDSRGRVSFYDYKTSPKEYGSFNEAKKRAFRFQLAMYGKLLRKYGLDYRDSHIGIMPIQFQELELENRDEAQSNPSKAKFKYSSIIYPSPENMIQDIKQDIFQITSKGEQPYLDPLDDYLPEEIIMDAPSEDIIQKTTEQMKIWFPDYNQYKAKSDEEISKFLEDEGAFVPEERNGEKIFVYKGRGAFSKEITAKSKFELVEKVKKHQEKLEKNKEWMTSVVIKALKYGQENNTTNIKDLIKSIDTRGLTSETALPRWFQDKLGKYCNGNWKVAEDLDYLKHFGIIVVKNVLNPQQIDIIKMTSTSNLYYNPFETNKSTKKKNSNHLLSAAFQPDVIELSNKKSLMLEGYKGNIELIETMLVLNNIPGLFKGEYSGAVIGEMQVMNSYRGEGISASNEELVYSFKKLSELSPISGENNITKGIIKFGTQYEIAANMFEDAMTSGSNFTLDETTFNPAKVMFDEAIDGDKEQKIKAILEIIRRMEQTYPELKNPVRREDLLDPSKQHIRLYYQMLQALASLRDIQFKQQIKDHDKWLEERSLTGILKRGASGTYLDNPGNHLSNTLNSITTLITQAYQNIRNKMGGRVAELRQATEELKKDKSFIGIRQVTGNATDLYKNMTKIVKGDLMFTDLNDPHLSNAERKYLKLILEIINENRFGGKYSKAQLEAMRDSYDERYYRVPLVRGTAESRDSIIGMQKGLMERLKTFQPKKVIEEMQAKVNGIFVEDADAYKDAEYLFNINNRFDRTENNLEERLEAIEKNGAGYFERNLEMLAFKHTFAYESSKELNKVLPIMKSAMAYLAYAGNSVNQNFVEDTKYFEDYLKYSVKGQPIQKNEDMKKATLVAGKLKQVASFMAMAFSPVQGIYQGIQGLWQDISLILRNRGIENTPFTLKNMYEAFKTVYKDLGHFSDTPTKCQLINEWLGVNDMDMNLYAERMRTDQHNKYNLTNLAFKFASRPDFYNRMTIIVAKMKQDGVWDALEVKDGKLVYNWKKDKRFDAFANNKTSDLNYNNQRALYYTIAQQFLNEGVTYPDGTPFALSETDTPAPLPYAWTNQEAESIKSLSDLIYGYYSHEKKSLIHATFLGSLYMQMRTFWSGKKNQYLAPGGVRIQGQWKQAIDKQTGKPLYYQLKEDGTIDYNEPPTIEVTSSPFYQWEGQWQEGIFLTLANIFRNGFSLNPVKFASSIKDGWNDTWNNENENIRNIRRSNCIQFLTDLAFWFIIGALLAGTFMSDWDKEVQREAKKSHDLGDATKATMVHIATMSMGQSADDFAWWSSIFGPTTDWSPFAFIHAINTHKKLWNSLFGDQRVYDGITNSFAVGKQFKPLMQWINPKEAD